MRMLGWLAYHFQWEPGVQTVADVPEQDLSGDVADCVLVFLHVEEKDMEERSHTFRKTLKQIKWQANKMGYKNIILHSFAHLGGQSAPFDFAWEFLTELAERLRNTGYQVWITPFGYTSEWHLHVRPESIGRVWKEI